MKPTSIILQLLILASMNSVFGQIAYSGFIDTYPVEFVIQPGYSYPDSQIYEATYMYNKFHNPIYLTGFFKKNILHLDELGPSNIHNAVLTFNKYLERADSILGEWKNGKTNKTLRIKLKRQYDFKMDYDSSNNYKNRELLQAVSLSKYYFKILISKNKDGAMSVDGIRLYSKKSNELYQELIAPACVFSEGIGINSISFHECDAGPDTCFAIYQMTSFNPAIDQYIHFKKDPITHMFTAQEGDNEY